MPGQKQCIGNPGNRKQPAHNWPLYVLVAPAVILAVIFCYIPMGGLVMAFQNYKPWLGISKSEFV